MIDYKNLYVKNNFNNKIINNQIYFLIKYI